MKVNFGSNFLVCPWISMKVTANYWSLDGDLFRNALGRESWKQKYWCVQIITLSFRSRDGRSENLLNPHLWTATVGRLRCSRPAEFSLVIRWNEVRHWTLVWSTGWIHIYYTYYGVEFYHRLYCCVLRDWRCECTVCRWTRSRSENVVGQAALRVDFILEWSRLLNADEKWIARLGYGLNIG